MRVIAYKRINVHQILESPFGSPLSHKIRKNGCLYSIIEALSADFLLTSYVFFSI